MTLLYNIDPAKNNAMRQQEIERLEALPDVQNVSLVDCVPRRGTWTTEAKALETKATPGSTPSSVLARHISPAYFDTLAIPIVRGRNFTRQEAQSGAPLAIVSAAMARQSWPEEDPLGKRIKSLTTGTKPEGWGLEVVALARDEDKRDVSSVSPAVS